MRAAAFTKMKGSVRGISAALSSAASITAFAASATTARALSCSAATIAVPKRVSAVASVASLGCWANAPAALTAHSRASRHAVAGGAAQS